MSDFEGKVALVTGGSRGIGRAICLELAARGALVAVNFNRSAAAAEDLVGEIIAAGGAAEAMQADVSDADQVGALFKTVLAKHGRIDILATMPASQRTMSL